MRGKKNEVVLRDARRREWLIFREPHCVLQTAEPLEVMPLLREVAARVRADGLFAAGFVAYEAAVGFDAAFRVHDPGAFPLIWFGLYPEPNCIPLEMQEGAEEGPVLGWRSAISLAQYRRAIRDIKGNIAAGRTYQVNYSLRLRAAFNDDGWCYFLRLVRAQEAPFGAYIDTGRYAICCASPELFFRLEAGHLESRPMKGTAARGLTWADDLAQSEWLRHSEKNRAENVMIVDMIRNDMGRVAQFGAVQVPQLFAVEKYPTVWQMTSTVTARTEKSIPEVLQALFPCASITGAPKHSTMRIIAELEQAPRRIYTGSIGYIAPDGKAQFNVAIRTVLVDRLSKIAEYGVGGGIVWDSTDVAEWEECATKARILTQQAPRFQLLETMLWIRETGYGLLTLHLQRLSRSADYFGFTLDMAAVCRRLQEAAGSFATDATRVRLLLAKDGAISLEWAPLARTSQVRARRVCLAPVPIESSDPFLYHKTTNRLTYARMLARCPEFDDVILWNERGEITESCLANLVVELDGERVTPPVSSGLLAGTYRQWMLDQGIVGERVIHKGELAQCTGLWLINSVRGEMSALLG
ncbi:MAG TPA: aminodeoxychorismate synthase component I, partial [Candidatus Binatia bacterium]|nr:aminodeoxychorismate synthase component I [Candidatus Binatia bacterium]